MPLFGPPNVQKLKAKGNVKGLINALGYKKDASVRQAAAEALDILGWNPDRDEVGALYWIEKRRWDECVETGVLAVKPLIAVLRDEELDKYVRRGAAEALGQIGSAQALSPLGIVLETEKDSDVRGAAVDALGQIGGAQAVNLLGAVLKTDESWWVRKAAVGGLGRIGDAQAVNLLGAVLETDKDMRVREAAAEVLGQIGDARAVNLLGAVLETEKKLGVRLGAVKALGQIGSAQAVNLLGAVLKTDEDWSMRETAARVLGHIGDSRAVGPLGIVLETEKNLAVRRGAVDALGQIGGAQAVKFLGAVLKTDESWWVRENAARALGQVGPACDIELLVTLLSNHDWRVRQAAFSGLQETGWEPCDDIERAAYWIASGEVNRLKELDCQAIIQLLVESMEWQTDPDDWYVKGQIAKLLVRPEIAANDSILARAVDELDVYANKCAEMLDFIVQNPRVRKSDRSGDRQAMFEDYAGLIVEATSYQVSDSGDGAGGRIYNYNTSSSLQAIKDICRISTPIATNLLHHLGKLGDIKVASRTFEVSYDNEHASGMGHHAETLSFKHQRDAAKRELARRGNPVYDLSAYKVEDCWCIPK